VKVAGPILLSLAIVIVTLGLVVGVMEKWSISESIYYAFITATTVGYGDFHPSHRRSRILAILIALTGIVLTGIIVALALHAASAVLQNTPEFNAAQEEAHHIRDSR